MRTRIGLSLAVVCVGLLLSGCGGAGGPEGVMVSGKVFQGGAPLQVPRRDVGLGSVEIRLVPVETTDSSGQLVRETETSMAEEDGSFQFLAGGRGMKPGKYKLAVYQHDQGYNSDKLQGAFSEEKTPIVVEIPEGKVGGQHDLGVIELNDAGRQ